MMSELEWLLEVDAKTNFDQLDQTLTECASVMDMTPAQYNLQNKDTIKVDVKIEGYRIIGADINIKLPTHTIKTCIKEPSCWRLYQIQDAINHLSQATKFLRSRQDQTAEEVLQSVNSIMSSLLKSRFSLLIARKCSVEELQHGQNMQSVSPALPLDHPISFHIQGNSLVFSVYQLAQAQVKSEYQARVTIPSLSESLNLLSLALQICQNLIDKIQLLQ